MRDDAADWADEVPLRHRCGVPDYYGCRVCMYASDDPDEDEAPINDDEGESDE